MYNFSRNLKLYVVKSGSRYKIDTYAGLDFSYVYNETSIERKTIHEQDKLHKGAVVNYITPGSLSFTTPLRYGNPLDFSIEGSDSYERVFYVEGDNFKLKINRAAIESIQYNFAREGVFTVTVRASFPTAEPVDTIPEPIVEETGAFGYIEKLQVLLEGQEVTNITGINLELSSDIRWIDYESIHEVSQGYKVARRDWVIAQRTYSGAIMQNLTTDTYDDQLITEDTSASSLYFKVSGANGTLLELTLAPITYTTRIDFGSDLVTKAYDFKMIGE